MELIEHKPCWLVGKITWKEQNTRAWPFLTKNEQLQTNKNCGGGCQHELFIINGISFPEGSTHPSKPRLIPPKSDMLYQRKSSLNKCNIKSCDSLWQGQIPSPSPYCFPLTAASAFPIPPCLHPTRYLILLMFCKMRKSPSAIAIMRMCSQDAH